MHAQDDSLEVVELAALLHDIKDWKYSKDAGEGAEAVEVCVCVCVYVCV
jgi:HD superfamily phosphodiesterase